MRTAVAMSGGVDSSVATCLLAEQGEDLIGVTMELGIPGETAADAARVAGALGIPHQTVSLVERFAEVVVGPFVAEYAAGRTPNPCVICNQAVKFGLLMEEARRLGAGRLATGHYARVDRDGKRPRLLRGIDRARDQSYFLHRLSAEQLSRAVMPVGHRTKDEVRGIARAAGLHVSEREATADACFVPGGDVGAFVGRRAPTAVLPGPILDTAGRVMGEHRGIASYTVGQRTGLGLSRPRPTYVLAIDPRRNAVVVGDEEELLKDSLSASGLSWVGERPPARFRAAARIRSTADPAPCAVELTGERAVVRFDRRQRAIAPGQSVVLYDGEEVLGGGVILPPSPGACLGAAFVV